VAIFRPADHRKARIVFANERPAQFHKAFDGPAPLAGTRARRKGNDKIMGPDTFARAHFPERAVFLVEPDLQAVIPGVGPQKS
jgi:hypothetical protein